MLRRKRTIAICCRHYWRVLSADVAAAADAGSAAGAGACAPVLPLLAGCCAPVPPLPVLTAECIAIEGVDDVIAGGCFAGSVVLALSAEMDLCADVTATMCGGVNGWMLMYGVSGA